MVIGNQDRYTRCCVDNDRSGWQIIQKVGGEDSITSSDESSAASIPFSCYSLVELWCQGGVLWARRGADCIAKREVVGSPAETTGPVTSRQSNRVVKEEQRGPGPWLCEWMLPILELCPASDPQVPVVVANQIPVVIYQTAAIPGEEATSGDGVKVPPWIDTIAQRPAPQR